MQNTFEQYFGKQITVKIKGFTEKSIYNVLGYDNNKDIVLETVIRLNEKELPVNGWFNGDIIKTQITTGFSNPFTVDKLWFNEELTGRKIELKLYEALGDCGIKKDKKVVGILKMVNDLICIIDVKNRVHSINIKTLT